MALEGAYIEKQDKFVISLICFYDDFLDLYHLTLKLTTLDQLKC